MKSKLFALLFSGVFMLGFGAAGMIGAKQLYTLLEGPFRAYRLIEVDASVLSVSNEPINVGKGRRTDRVATRYTYKFERETYTGTRIGFRETLNR
jgi:hypothetical protein